MPEKNLENFKLIEEEIEEPKKSKVYKLIIFLGGILMLLLMTSYLIIGSPLSNILEGQIESHPLQDERIDLDELSIIFTGETSNILQSLYFNEQEVEFSVCLQGTKIENEYYITGLYSPTMLVQTFNHVQFEPCSDETLILLHTHPYKSCLASATDLRTLENMKLRNEDVLMVVMCEPARFSVYG
jgi:proteasome lid subunit RPN8/RPN11